MVKVNVTAKGTKGIPITQEMLVEALIGTMNQQEIDKKQRGFLCMLSGGLGSTAMLHALLTNEEYEQFGVYVHHVQIMTRENRGPAELIATRKIVEYYSKREDLRRFNYRETVVDMSTLDKDWSKVSWSNVIDITAFVAAQICKAKPTIKYVGYGVNGDDFKASESRNQYEEAPKIFEAAMYGFPHNIPRPAIIYPLQHLRRKKIWKTIPPKVQPMLQICQYPAYDGNGKPQICESCDSCKYAKIWYTIAK